MCVANQLLLLWPALLFVLAGSSLALATVAFDEGGRKFAAFFACLAGINLLGGLRLLLLDPPGTPYIMVGLAVLAVAVWVSYVSALKRH